MSVMRIVTWNQSSRCSACGFRYSGSAGSQGWSLTRSEMRFDVVGKVRWSGMGLVTLVGPFSAGFREVRLQVFDLGFGFCPDLLRLSAHRACLPPCGFSDQRVEAVLAERDAADAGAFGDAVQAQRIAPRLCLFRRKQFGCNTSANRGFFRRSWHRSAIYHRFEPGRVVGEGLHDLACGGCARVKYGSHSIAGLA